MLTVVLIAAQGLALGYLIGRSRPVQRINERLYQVWYHGQLTGRRGLKYRAAQACFTVLVGAAAVAHPLRFYREFWGCEKPEELVPAPRIDPHWGPR